MEGAAVLGRNVRHVRAERQLSLGALAQRAGVAKQTLANLENGAGNPTVETLLAVAGALGVGASWLMTDWGSPVLVQRSSGTEWVEEGCGRRRLLDQIHGTGQVTTSLIEVGPERDVRPALPHGAVHHVFVVRGSVAIGPVDDVRTLDENDFIRFAGDVPYVVRAASDRLATMHFVTTVPQVQQFSPA